MKRWLLLYLAMATTFTRAIDVPVPMVTVLATATEGEPSGRQGSLKEIIQLRDNLALFGYNGRTWITQGTQASTKSIGGGDSGSFDSDLVTAILWTDDEIVWGENQFSTSSYKLRSYNLQTEVTTDIRDFSDSIDNIVLWNNALYIEVANELWTSKGTNETTMLLADSVPAGQLFLVDNDKTLLFVREGDLYTLIGGNQGPVVSQVTDGRLIARVYAYAGQTLRGKALLRTLQLPDGRESIIFATDGTLPDTTRPVFNSTNFPTVRRVLTIFPTVFGQDRFVFQVDAFVDPPGTIVYFLLVSDGTIEGTRPLEVTYPDDFVYEGVTRQAFVVNLTEFTDGPVTLLPSIARSGPVSTVGGSGQLCFGTSIRVGSVEFRERGPRWDSGALWYTNIEETYMVYKFEEGFPSNFLSLHNKNNNEGEQQEDESKRPAAIFLNGNGVDSFLGADNWVWITDCTKNNTMPLYNLGAFAFADGNGPFMEFLNDRELLVEGVHPDTMTLDDAQPVFAVLKLSFPKPLSEYFAPPAPATSSTPTVSPTITPSHVPSVASSTTPLASATVKRNLSLLLFGITLMICIGKTTFN